MELFPFVIHCSEEEKKSRNLRVLHNLIPDHHFDDYIFSNSNCSVYIFKNNAWQKLKITGTLFVLTSQDKCPPIIFILNNQMMNKAKDFILQLPLSSKISTKSQTVYFELSEDNYFCISTKDDVAANILAKTLQNYIISGVQDHNVDSQVLRDPSYKHLVSYMRKRNV